MTSGKQTVDFINVEDTAKTILDSVNFKKKNMNFIIDSNPNLNNKDES